MGLGVGGAIGITGWLANEGGAVTPRTEEELSSARTSSRTSDRKSETAMDDIRVEGVTAFEVELTGLEDCTGVGLAAAAGTPRQRVVAPVLLVLVGRPRFFVTLGMMTMQ